jgi:hypothetical protein
LFLPQSFSGWQACSNNVQSERKIMMFNDRLTDESANERIAQRVKEVEMYSLQKRLGFSEYGAAKWIFLLVIIAIAVGLLY